MHNDPRSFARLLADTVDHTTKLLRSEFAVARAEMAEKASQAVSGASLLIVAAILLIPVVTVMLLALATWFGELGLRPSLALLCAGGSGLILIAVIAIFGKSRVAPDNLKPDHIIEELERDKDAAQRGL